MIRVTRPVADSEIQRYSVKASYCDAYAISVPHDDRPLLALAIELLGSTPGWINRLMLARNTIVSSLGLKDLGGMSDVRKDKSIEDYQPGDRVGIFTLVYISASEVVLGDADKHLDVRVSIHRASAIHVDELTVTTVVHNHNWGGRIYMLFVTPAHKVIVRALLKRYLQRHL